jgi:peptide deformylase
MIRLHGFRVAANVTDVTRFAETEIRPKPDALIETMIVAMRQKGLVGIAAPQVGFDG